MKGLWVKDLLMLKKQWKLFALFMLITVFNGYVNQSVDFVFLLMSFFFVTIATTTILYDQENQGYIYLFALPIKKMKYVIQKELLIIVLIVTSIIMSLLFVGVMVLSQDNFTISGEKLILLSSVALLFGCLTGSILTPLYLKFGSEQARLVVLILMGTIFGGGFLAQKTGFISWLTSNGFLDTISTMSAIQLAGVSVVIVAVFTSVSAVISERVIKI
ncbi:ABC-2 transporter permease [Marinilactibacillus psychrotolerans]|uniref:ABC-2 transporter permease n=1 Tax=Marinilactibacillus psychrotolerans TaxID=191770 RepID=A0ABW8UKF6_9LACT